MFETCVVVLKRAVSYLLRATRAEESADHLAACRETKNVITLRVPDGSKAGGNMQVTDPEGRKVQIMIPQHTK